jgi:hypothetical protein
LEFKCVSMHYRATAFNARRIKGKTPSQCKRLRVSAKWQKVTFNQGVPGSNPGGLTNIIRDLFGTL